MRQTNGTLHVTVFAVTAEEARELVAGRGFVPVGAPVQVEGVPGLPGWEVPVELPAALLGSVA